MLLANPFTGVVINHPGHPDQSVHGKPEPGKFYKGIRLGSRSKRLSKSIYEGPFASKEDAIIHADLTDDLDRRASNFDFGYLRSASGSHIPIAEGSLLREDWDEAEAGNSQDVFEKDDDIIRLKKKYRIVRPRPLKYPNLRSREH